MDNRIKSHVVGAAGLVHADLHVCCWRCLQGSRHGRTGQIGGHLLCQIDGVLMEYNLNELHVRSDTIKDWTSPDSPPDRDQ